MYHQIQIDQTQMNAGFCYLIAEDNSGQLKEHLIEELDYVLLPAEAWEKLVGWYHIAEGQVCNP